MPELVGTSAAIADVRAAIARSAAAPFAVVQGESHIAGGLVSRVSAGARRERRFCDVIAGVGAVVDSRLPLVQAIADGPGLFEAAHGEHVSLDRAR